MILFLKKRNRILFYPFYGGPNIVDFTKYFVTADCFPYQGGDSSFMLPAIDSDDSTRVLIGNTAPILTFRNRVYPLRVLKYSVTSGPDLPGRDWKTWTLRAKNNDSDVWTTIDTRTNESFSSRLLRREFVLSFPADYKQFEFVVTNNGDVQYTHLNGLELIGEGFTSSLSRFSYSSRFDANNTGENVVPGGTYGSGNWISQQNTLPAWVQYNFANKFKLTGYKISSNGGNRAPRDWEIRASNDDFVNYVTIDFQTGQSFPNSDKRKFYVVGAEAYRSYRLYVTAIQPGNDGYLQITEWEPLSLLNPDSLVLFEDSFNGSALDEDWTQISSAYATQSSFASGKMTLESAVAGTGDIGANGVVGYRRSDLPTKGDFYIECDISSNDASTGAYNYAGLFMARTESNQVFIAARSNTFNTFVLIAQNYSETGAWTYANSVQNTAPLVSGIRRFRLTWIESNSMLSAAVMDPITGYWTHVGAYTMLRPNRYGLSIHGNNPSAHHNLTSENLVIKSRPLAGTITASSILDGNNISSFAFDGRFDRGWHSTSGVGPHWIQEELPIAKRITKFYITSNSFLRSRDPRNFRMLVSNDGSNFDVGATFTNESWLASGQRREFVIQNPGFYKYYRLEVTENNFSGDGFVYIAELELSDEPLFLTDNFSDGFLTTRWNTPITTTSPTFITLNDGALTFKPSILAGVDSGKRGAWGFRENVENGSFEIKARLKGSYQSSGNARICLFVASTSTAKAQSFGILNYSTYSGATHIAESLEMNYYENADWDGGAFQDFRNNVLNADYIIYRILYDAVSLRLQFSYSLDDGVSWIYLNGRAGISQPDRRGLAIFSFDPNVPSNQNAVVDYVVTTKIPVPSVGYLETPIIESTSDYPGLPASRLFDNDYTTSWISNTGVAFPHTITTKTTAHRQVNRLLMACSSINDYGNLDPTFLRGAKNFTVQGSNNNGGNWDTLGTFINVFWTNYSQEREFVMTSPGSYKWVRIVITANNGDVNYTALGQLRFSQ